MTKFLIRAVLLLLTVAVGITWPSVRAAVPNFLLLLVVMYSLREDTEAYLGFAFCGGLLFDCYATSAFGSYALGLLCIGLMIRLATSTLFRSELHSPLYLAVAIVASDAVLVVFLYVFTTFAMLWQHGLQALSPLYITHAAWLSLLFDLIAAIPFYFLVDSIETFISRNTRPETIAHR